MERNRKHGSDAAHRGYGAAALHRHRRQKPAIDQKRGCRMGNEMLDGGPQTIESQLAT